MNRRTLRAVILSALGIGIAVGASSPASANHNSGFDKGEYQVAEAAGYVELTIGSDPCCPPGSGQFDYYTANLSALAGSDYEQTSGTVTTAFCGCSIRVEITNDELFEGEEQFEVRLTNFRGTFNPENPERRRAVVKILDDDPKPASRSTLSGPSGHPAATSGGTSSTSTRSRPGATNLGTGAPAGETLSEEARSEAGAKVIPDDSVAEGADKVVPKAGLRTPHRDISPLALILTIAMVVGITAAVGFLWRLRFGRNQQ